MNATSLKFDGLAVLDHLGVIEATGADAATFLHNQLTQDVALLDLQHARLAAWCSAKGRMLASFVLFKATPERILLVCSRDVLAPTLKRLSMFVLRSKCKLSDASSQYTLLGAAGSAVAHPQPPWSLHTDLDTHWVSLYPANDTPRALGLMPSNQPAPAPTLSKDAWLLSEVLSGIATLTQPVAEAFVPQMLNYESVGGVNFKKGCYPGQEVVARSQFRGTLKRRASVLACAQPMQAGQEVFSAAEPDQPCGLIAQAASSAGQHCAIASLQLSALDSTLHLGSAAGPKLDTLPLPYALLEDI